PCGTGWPGCGRCPRIGRVRDREHEKLMKLSVIIPAFNEEKLIGRCLEAARAALEANASTGWSYEIIVVDNNSTDATAALAQEAGARVVFEPINQISRARNAGAGIALGDWFLFVDADSYLHPVTAAELVDCIRKPGVVGGGCLIGFDSDPGWAGICLEL